LCPSLTPARATEHIRAKSRSSDFRIDWTKHAIQQMLDRELIPGDVLHVLKNGFVYNPGQPSTRIGLYNYQMESPSPNSGGRTVRVVVIPFPTSAIKVVTVMWVDEPLSGG